MKSRILIGLIMGTLGGFFGWLLQETLVNYNEFIVKDLLTGQCLLKDPPASKVHIVYFSICGLTGIFLGAVDGIVEGNSRKLIRGILIGVFGGIVLGTLGAQIAGQVYNLLGGATSTVKDPSIFAFARQVIARAFQLGLMGLGIGCGVACGTLTLKRIWHGAFGGLIGGLISGIVFDLISGSSVPLRSAFGSTGCIDAGGPGRAIAYTLIGALTGFFVNLIDELLKQAWVKVLAGRNEGKDFILSKTVSILGRDERCDVPLYGDPAVGAQHAAIRADGSRHVLIDAGTSLGTVVNGQTIVPGSELLLRDGDMIQIGNQRILFREKATQSRVAPSPLDAPRGKSAGPMNTPMPSHLCPFCGGAKDINGNCLCTPAHGTGYSPNTAPNTSAGGGFANMNGQPMDYMSGAPSYGNTSPDFQQNSAGGSPFAAGQLVGLEGSVAGQVFGLVGTNMTLGREPGRDIVVLGDSTVSRTHARLANENGVFMVYDNNSANGTFVNGVRIQMQALAPGDVVQFGNSKFRFE